MNPCRSWITLTINTAGTESPDFVEYRDTDVSKLTEGTPLLLGGMPDYNAIYNDGTNNYIGYNTNQGTVWYLSQVLTAPRF